MLKLVILSAFSFAFSGAQILKSPVRPQSDPASVPISTTSCPLGYFGPTSCTLNGIAQQKCVKALAGFFDNPSIVESCDGSTSKESSICPSSHPFFDSQSIKPGCVKVCSSGSSGFTCQGRGVCLRTTSATSGIPDEKCSVTNSCPDGWIIHNSKCVKSCPIDTVSVNCRHDKNVLVPVCLKGNYGNGYLETCPTPLGPIGFKTVTCITNGDMAFILSAPSTDGENVPSCPPSLSSSSTSFCPSFHAAFSCDGINMACFPTNSTTIKNEKGQTIVLQMIKSCPGASTFRCPEKTVKVSCSYGDRCSSTFLDESQVLLLAKCGNEAQTCPVATDLRTCPESNTVCTPKSADTVPVCKTANLNTYNPLCPIEKPNYYVAQSCSKDCPTDHAVVSCSIGSSGTQKTCVKRYENGISDSATATCPDFLNASVSGFNCPIGYGSFSCGRNVPQVCLKIRPDGRSIERCPTLSGVVCPLGFNEASNLGSNYCSYACPIGQVSVQCGSSRSCIEIISGNFSLSSGVTNGYVKTCPTASAACPSGYPARMTCSNGLAVKEICAAWLGPEESAGTNVPLCPGSSPVCPDATAFCPVDKTCSLIDSSVSIKPSSQCLSKTCPTGYTKVSCNGKSFCLPAGFFYSCRSESSGMQCPNGTKAVSINRFESVCQSFCQEGYEWLECGAGMKCFKSSPFTLAVETGLCPENANKCPNNYIQTKYKVPYYSKTDPEMIVDTCTPLAFGTAELGAVQVTTHKASVDLILDQQICPENMILNTCSGDKKYCFQKSAFPTRLASCPDGKCPSGTCNIMGWKCAYPFWLFLEFKCNT